MEKFLGRLVSQKTLAGSEPHEAVIFAQKLLIRFKLASDSQSLDFDEAFRNEWEIVREPGVDPAFERANPGDSFGSQL